MVAAPKAHGQVFVVLATPIDISLIDAADEWFVVGCTRCGGQVGISTELAATMLIKTIQDRNSLVMSCPECYAKLEEPEDG